MPLEQTHHSTGPSSEAHISTRSFSIKKILENWTHGDGECWCEFIRENPRGPEAFPTRALQRS
jgi:hypothetical protein